MLSSAYGALLYRRVASPTALYSKRGTLAPGMPCGMGGRVRMFFAGDKNTFISVSSVSSIVPKKPRPCKRRLYCQKRAFMVKWTYYLYPAVE